MAVHYVKKKGCTREFFFVLLSAACRNGTVGPEVQSSTSTPLHLQTKRVEEQNNEAPLMVFWTRVAGGSAARAASTARESHDRADRD
jgi:hypothetical protein